MRGLTSCGTCAERVCKETTGIPATAKRTAKSKSATVFAFMSNANESFELFAEGAEIEGLSQPSNETTPSEYAHANKLAEVA